MIEIPLSTILAAFSRSNDETMLALTALTEILLLDRPNIFPPVAFKLMPFAERQRSGLL